MKNMTTKITIICIGVSLALASVATSTDYYVSAARGKGKSATKEKPAKDLGNIISKLEAGDTIHIAGGVYTGRGDNGAYLITVPVSVIGGYNDDFSSRDPWGVHRTILSGDNLSKNFESSPRFMMDLMKYKGKEMPKILIDGLIIDESARNRYKTEKKLVIVRMANPKTGENPTPSQGAFIIRVSKTGNFNPGAHWEIEVKNCVVTNSAPTQGAFSVSGYKGSKIRIVNNIVINNTGSAIYAGTKYVGDESPPEFDIENNTVLFTWKYEPGSQSFSGNSFKADSPTVIRLKNNVLGFADRAGIYNAAKTNILLQNNMILGNVEMDYLEFDTRIDLDDIEDEADFIHEDSEGNVAGELKIPISADWLKLYGGRILVDRNAREADIKVQATRANELRRILGLPVQAGAVAEPEKPTWLPALSLDDAIKAGSAKYNASFGSSFPGPFF